MLHQTCMKPDQYLSSLLAPLTGAQAMEARRIYAAMKDGLCRPDALTLTSLATAYQRAGKWDWAEQVLPCTCLLHTLKHYNVCALETVSPKHLM